MASLSQYDRLDVDAPTLQRTCTRKPGTGQPLLAPVLNPDKPKETRKSKPHPDARLYAIHSTVFTVLVPALKAETNPVKRERILSEIKRLRAQALELAAAVGLRPSATRARRDDGSTYRASQREARQMTAARAQHALAESADRGW